MQVSTYHRFDKMLRPADMGSISAVATAQRPHILWVVGVVPDKMGGFERTCVEFAKQASQRGVRASFVFEGEPCRALAQSLAELSADFHVIADVGVLGVTHSLRLANIVRRLRPDYVHLHFCEFYRPFYPLAALLRVPLVATYHYSGEPSPSYGLRKRLKQAKRALLSGSLRRISAVSDASRQKFAVDYCQDSAKILVTYNGTDLGSARVNAIAKNALAIQRLAPRSVSPKVLFVGSLSTEKGVEHAIRALAFLAPDFPDVTLTLVGTGPEQSALKALVSELGLDQRVAFLGVRSDVPQILASHDMLVVPSTWKEAFGYVIVEAMAVGCPVIASNIGGIPEVVTDGLEGILVEPANAQVLAAAISRLANDARLRDDLASRAREKVRNVFALDRSVDRFWQLYD